jgi:hypothetical protein
MVFEQMGGRGDGNGMSLSELSERVQLILAMDKSVCAFCCVQMKEKEGIMLDGCLHTFCRSGGVSTHSLIN